MKCKLRTVLMLALFFSLSIHAENSFTACARYFLKTLWLTMKDYSNDIAVGRLYNLDDDPDLPDTQSSNTEKQ